MKIEEKIISRFIEYIQIPTASDKSSGTVPSTEGQMKLAKKLKNELESIGLEKIELDEHGYLMASLPSNITHHAPVIGFIAHLDTSSEVKADNIRPQIIDNYNGQDIVLNKEKNIIIPVNHFPWMKKHKNEKIIVTDGTTLLGADDKAGIAEIITAVEYLTEHPEIKHGEIRICFTPDEEIARGVDFFDIQKFNADFAYTVDGGLLGELEYETFNGAEAEIQIHGYNFHPGYAKGYMINANRLAMEFNAMLPQNEKPEYTEGYEGYFHLLECSGNVEKASLYYIIRDHDRNKFEQRKTVLQDIADFMNKKYDKKPVEITLKDQYFNMKEKIEPVMHIVELAKQSMLDAGITPIIKPIRGGTDGARLSFKGLPCPNLFTGGYNFHSRYEYVSVPGMKKAVEVILKIIENNAGC
jgi:tripeptide aminopeptidase